MDVIFERASVEDTDELMAVQNAAFESDFRKYGICPSYIQQRGRMVEKISAGIFYRIRQKDGRIVGGMDIRPRNPFHYHLYMLCVHPEFQNRGIGTQAIQFALAQHPEARFWSLVTPKDNPLTRHLYEKMGFVFSGERQSPEGVPLVMYELLRPGI